MQGLMEELTELSRRNDELMTAKDADLAVIRDLDAQCKEYKRKYELAKTELRGLKGLCSLEPTKGAGPLKMCVYIDPNCSSTHRRQMTTSPCLQMGRCCMSTSPHLSLRSVVC